MHGTIDTLNMKTYLETLSLDSKKLDCSCWEKHGSQSQNLSLNQRFKYKYTFLKFAAIFKSKKNVIWYHTEDFWNMQGLI